MSDQPTKDSGEKAPRGPGEGKRGPLRKKLDRRQRERFLELLAQGHGQQSACLQMGVAFRVLRNTLAASESFKQDAADALEASFQVTEKVAKDVADTAHDEILPFQVSRIDKRRQLNQARQDALIKQGSGANEAALMAVAYKVATYFAEFIPSDRLPDLMQRIPSLVTEASGAGKPALPSLG